MIKALVVDDEIESSSFLVRVLETRFQDFRAFAASTVNDAIQLIHSDKPDVVFLDILMDAENGFDIFESLPTIDFEIIFTTGHNEFAIKAFKFNAIDFLLKPIDIEELDEAVSKLRKKMVEKRRLSGEQIASFIESMRRPIKRMEKLAIPSSSGFVLIPLRDIIFCESDENYTKFILVNDRKMLSSYTLKEYDEMLTHQNFFRAHKSYLVNIGHIIQYAKRGEGGILVMSNGMEIEVSRRNKEELMKIFKAI